MHAIFHKSIISMIIEKEEGLETHVQVYGRCSPQSHDSIKVCESRNFATLAKATFVALDRDLVHL